MIYNLISRVSIYIFRRISEFSIHFKCVVNECVECKGSVIVRYFQYISNVWSSHQSTVSMNVLNVKVLKFYDAYKNRQEGEFPETTIKEMTLASIPVRTAILRVKTSKKRNQK